MIKSMSLFLIVLNVLWAHGGTEEEKEKRPSAFLKRPLCSEEHIALQMNWYIFHISQNVEGFEEKVVDKAEGLVELLGSVEGKIWALHQKDIIWLSQFVPLDRRAELASKWEESGVSVRGADDWVLGKKDTLTKDGMWYQARLEVNAAFLKVVEMRAHEPWELGLNKVISYAAEGGYYQQWGSSISTRWGSTLILSQWWGEELQRMVLALLETPAPGWFERALEWLEAYPLFPGFPSQLSTLSVSQLGREVARANPFISCALFARFTARLWRIGWFPDSSRPEDQNCPEALCKHATVGEIWPADKGLKNKKFRPSPLAKKKK